MSWTHRAKDAAGRDAGSAAVEVTLLAPMLIVLLLFVVGVGRLASARLAVQDAAQQAARTVTMARDPAAAESQARSSATAALSGSHLPCRSVTAAITLTGDSDANLGAGTVRPRQAKVEITCVILWADLTGLALPATQSLTGRAVSPIDVYRGT